MHSRSANSLSGESIICFAGEDWWYHHPHSKNHILKRYARENTVLFVNSITMGLPSIANPDFFLKIRRKLKSYLRWLRKVPEGLWVMTPINLPFYGTSLGRSINRILLQTQLRLAMLLLRMRNPILWVAIPTAAEMVGRLGEKLLLYQVSDKYDANEDSALAPAIIRTYDHQLKTAAAVVLYSGRKLFQEASEPHRFFLEQAVDFEHFAQQRTDVAPDVESIPSPILGYFGSMDYVMDTELISEVARLRPHWHWVLLGLKSNLVRVDAPNVHFLGSKALPRFAPVYRAVQRVRFAMEGNECIHKLRQRHQGSRVPCHGQAGGHGSAVRVPGNTRPPLLSWRPRVHRPGRGRPRRR